MHDLLQGDDPSADGQPILPPVVDGLVEYIDCGVLSCWDDLSETAFDLAGLEGSNDYLRQNAADLPFIGTPGTRAVANHWLSTGAQAGNLLAQAPFSSNLLLHSGDFGQGTVIAVFWPPAETPTEATLVGATDSNGSNGCAFQFQNTGSRYRSRQGNANSVNSGIDMGSPWEGTIKPRVLTWIFDSNDNLNGFVKLDGETKIAMNTNVNNNTTNTQAFRLWGVPAGNRIPLGTKCYAYLYYDRLLTDQEVIDLENFFLDFLQLSDIINGNWRVINEVAPGGGNNEWEILEIEFQIATAIQPVTAPFSLLNTWTDPALAFNGDVSNDRQFAQSVKISGIREAAIGAAFGETKNIDLVRIFQGTRGAPDRTVTGATVQSSDDQGQTWRDRCSNLALDPNGGVFDTIAITP